MFVHMYIVYYNDDDYIPNPQLILSPPALTMYSGDWK